MTESLLPLLEKASPDARVITVSSGGMYTSPLTNDLQVTLLKIFTCFLFTIRYKKEVVVTVSFQFSGTKFDGVEQYTRNKRIQVSIFDDGSYPINY